jgi:phenylacetate-CoA ligase
MNWRKPLIFAGFYLTGSKIPEYLKEIEELQYKTRDEIKRYQEEKLKRLLLHAYENVPYYNKVLRESEVVIDGNVNLDNFSRIPILTKEIIRKEEKNLYSRDYKKRKPYENTSGGSTGEPVKFIQDKEYFEWNVATKIYYSRVLGKDIGEKELKFWGSERDIIKGNLTFKDIAINYLYNIIFFNSYNLNEESINKLIYIHNNLKPSCYWSYEDAAFEFSKIIIDRNIRLYTPKFIITTINPLTDVARKSIEKAFGCPVYDQYGSREVGPAACQCREKKELHTFPWFNFVEILDRRDIEVESGEEGRIIMTNLRNYSMPLIRYNIGDVAVSAGYSRCKCGRNFLSLEEILGRTLGYFKKRDGSLIHSHYIVQRLFFKSWIKRFQIVQGDFEHIIIRIEKDGESDEKDLDDISNKTKILMGKDCKVEFEFVDEIEPSKSGKYLYTRCEIE